MARMRYVAHAVIIILSSSFLHATSPAFEQRALSVTDAWVKLPAAGETSAAAFAVINNPSMYDAYVVSVSTEAAATVQFRDAAAKEVKELTVPAYDKVELSVKGTHLWLAGLKRPLKEGETIALTLTTDDGSSMKVSAQVR